MGCWAGCADTSAEGRSRRWDLRVGASPVGVFQLQTEWLQQVGYKAEELSHQGAGRWQCLASLPSEPSGHLDIGIYRRVRCLGKESDFFKFFFLRKNAACASLVHRILWKRMARRVLPGSGRYLSRNLPRVVALPFCLFVFSFAFYGKVPSCSDCCKRFWGLGLALTLPHLMFLCDPTRNSSIWTSCSSFF